MDGMKEFPDKYFELAIIDPQYGKDNANAFCKYSNTKVGNGLAERGNYKMKDWDKEPPKKEYFDELFRVSKNQIIWGANHFISKIPYDSSCWVVWDKHINGKFADCELAWTSFDIPVKKFDFTWNGMIQGDMKNKEKRIHPTQKPVALYAWLLNKYAKKGDKILDTHLGSASSIVACHNLGFEYCGFELDKEYFELAQERINAVKAQVSIFDKEG